MKAILLVRSNLEKILVESPAPGKQHLLVAMETYKDEKKYGKLYFIPDDGRYPENSWRIFMTERMNGFAFDEDAIKKDFVTITPLNRTPKRERVRR